MELSREGRPTVDELYRVLEAQAARIDELEVSLHAVLRETGLVTRGDGGGGSRLSRAVFLKTAAAALAAGSVVAAAADEPALAAAAGIVGSWIVSITYSPADQRTRGLATFAPGGGFVASISAYEEAPAQPTPSRGTTLHGAWVATGGRSYAVSATRLHLDESGTLIGVMSTRIKATLAAGRDSWAGSFTFDAARPDGQVFKRGKGKLRGVRVAAPS
jgi:hypothetical protein